MIPLTRLTRIWKSYRSLPFWVQVWVGLILVPTNAIPFFFLPQEWAKWGCMASLFVIATNVPIMWFEQGMSRLMSIPHLIAWVPLHYKLLSTLLGEGIIDPEARFFIWYLVAINSISLVFDFIDSWRWLRGERVMTPSSS